jgi:hypothetical protein
MTEPITEERVIQVFQAVLECLDRCKSVHGLWRAVYPDDEARTDPNGNEVTAKRVALLVKGMKELKFLHERLMEELQPFEWDLPGLVEGTVRESGVTASSWTLGVVRLAEGLTEGLAEWKRLAELDARRRRDLVNRLFNLTPVHGQSPDFELFRASVEVEAARMLEKARAMAPAVRYAYEYMHLRGQSRKLFMYLSENPGRRIEKTEIAEEVMDKPDASAGSIHTAISKLKAGLVAFGSEEIAKAITQEGGAYRFR